MVRIYKEQFGRGPTKTRTHWSRSDILVVSLEQTSAAPEHSLREHERLRELRLLSFSTPRRACSASRSSASPGAGSSVYGIDTAANFACEMFVAIAGLLLFPWVV
jgi:Na+-translocating membrane potential-generating system (MpsC)